MAETNPDDLIRTQLEAALRATKTNPDPAPNGATMPARVEPEAVVPAAPTEPVAAPAATPAPETPAAPANPQLEALVKDNAELRKQLQALNKQIAPLKQAFAPETPAPAKPTVSTTASELAALRAEVEDMVHISSIEREISVLPEYAILKSMPDLAKTVLNYIKEEKRVAQENGEGSRQVTTAQAAAKIKEQYVAMLKSHLSNSDLAREVGLTMPARNQAPAPRTSDLTSSMPRKTTSPVLSADDLVRRQLEMALKYAESKT